MKYYCWLLLLLILGLPLSVHAQDASQIIINYPETADSGDGMQLGLYFTIADSAGDAVSTAEVQNARIVLDDGSSYDAQVSQPKTPFYIALVLDASGSMTSAAQAMRQSAVQIVQTAPEEARFAVFSFSEKVTNLQDFTSDRNLASNAIGNIQPVNLSGTCLYDAAFNAIQLVSQQPTGRRAIVLFTDGVDETAQGKNCSQKTYDEVVESANRPDLRVPIYTIGLRGNKNPLNENELRNLARVTGGLTTIGAAADLPSLFQRIMNGLGSQWLASSVVYPTQGTRTATLIVNLKNDVLLQPDAATFQAARNYVKPNGVITSQGVGQPSIQVESIELDNSKPDGLNILVHTTIEGESAISDYRIDLKDAGNLLKGSYSFKAPLANPVSLVAANLIGGTYSITIAGLSGDGRVIVRSPEERFTYSPLTNIQTATPIQASASILSIKLDDTQQNFVISVNAVNDTLIRRYVLEFVDNNTNLLKNTFTFDVPPYDSLHVPLSNLDAGEYTITLRALDANNSILGESSLRAMYNPPTPTPPPVATSTPSPTLIPTGVPLLSAEGLRQNMSIVLPIIIILVVALIVLLFILLRHKPNPTGTAFLSEITGVQEAKDIQSSYNPSSGPYDPNATNPVPSYDPDATNPIPQLLLPNAKLTVIRSRDATIVGKQVVINHVPFTLGRKGRDLDFDADTNISREHAQITFTNGAFYLTDLGSVHGTLLGGQAIPKRSEVPLYGGEQITLGTGSILLFEREANGFDPQATNTLR